MSDYNDADLDSFPDTVRNRFNNEIDSECFQRQERKHEKIRIGRRSNNMNQRTGEFTGMV